MPEIYKDDSILSMYLRHPPGIEVINVQNETDDSLISSFSEKISDFAVEKLVNDCEAVEKKSSRKYKSCSKKAVQATHEKCFKKRSKDVYIYS